MAQYGSGDQLRREGRQTDEYGNPIHSATVGQFGDEVRRADEYGNQQIRKTDEFGNPIHSGGTMGGDYGSTGHQHGLGQTTGGLGTEAYGTTTGHGTGGATGGDFDYGSGGRSTGQTGYQGLGTEPGSYQNQPSATTMGGGAGGGFGTGTGAGTGRYEEKGVMEKIKEKLPGGGHGTEEQHRMGGGVYEESGHEKKGVMEKIKEKLPGGRH